ncbi:hypothetical protein CAI21_10750 [Alkalilimnicola ehrlichii]|uniref:Aminoglycoside (3'') (9) adenylyltransferase n=1 Tax=Alkalilimnicola ehrlichii TaxID=351052 RepID=A0A3E0WTI2_9GAMM|nr:aminoglycoside adenylyltransferase family protein [Alkalilimnicola ehrlichii]RFA29236.1 hypothetical protein CAI21_10750 [Alkalilimnicola ehrlichii]RFA36148.1 hypothetical protein CAL65_11900 [Alkalilimnicola ehrlichii]
MVDNRKTIEIPSEAEQAQAAVRDLLGDSLVGIYLFGSAVIGGLRVDSDVDLLVATARPLGDEERSNLLSRLLRISGRVGESPAARPLELTVLNVPDVVPWRYPPAAEFVYGEWLRDDFEAGSVPQPVTDPDLTIVLKKVLDHSVPLYGPNAGELFEPVTMSAVRQAIRDSLPAVLGGVEGDERNTILTLARMWLTLAEGDIAPKDVAAEWAIKQLPVEHGHLLGEARLAYLGRTQDDWGPRAVELEKLVRYMEGRIIACLNG